MEGGQSTDADTGGRLRRWYRTSLVGAPDGRDSRQLWIGDTISQFGTQIGAIALPLMAVTLLAADDFQMGLLATFEKPGLPADRTAGGRVGRSASKRRVLILG